MAFLTNSILLVFIFLISNSTYADEFHLELSRYDNKQVLLLVYHNGYSNKAFNKRALCLSGLGGLKLEISDIAGVKYPKAALINDRCKLHEVIELEPFGVYGKFVNDVTFESTYGLKTGTYNVKAIMCDYGSDPQNCLESNSISITIEN